MDMSRLTDTLSVTMSRDMTSLSDMLSVTNDQGYDKANRCFICHT